MTIHRFHFQIQFFFSLSFLSLFLSSCAVEINSDQDNSVNFNQYKTFAWYARGQKQFANSAYDNQIVESNIKNTGSSALKVRGLVVDVDSPDVLLDYDIMVQRKTEQVDQPIYSHPYNYNPWTGRMFYTGSYVVGYRTQTIPYQEGTLTLSAIDRKTNRLIWRGWAEQTVDDPQSYDASLQSDVLKIMKRFPLPVVVKH